MKSRYSILKQNLESLGSVADGLPVFGTCAGLILLADNNTKWVATMNIIGKW